MVQTNSGVTQTRVPATTPAAVTIKGIKVASNRRKPCRCRSKDEG